MKHMKKRNTNIFVDQVQKSKINSVHYSTYRSPGLSCAVQFEHVKHFTWNTWCWIGFGWFGDCWLLDCDVARMTYSFGDIVWLHAEHGGGANILRWREKKWDKHKTFICVINCFFLISINQNWCNLENLEKKLFFLANFERMNKFLHTHQQIINCVRV